jgi:hypothetical protein
MSDEDYEVYDGDYVPAVNYNQDSSRQNSRAHVGGTPLGRQAEHFYAGSISRPDIDIEAVEAGQPQGKTGRQVGRQEDPFKGKRGGRGGRKFSFTYEDIARHTGKQEVALRKQVSRKKLDLDDLSVFFQFCLDNLP